MSQLLSPLCLESLVRTPCWESHLEAEQQRNCWCGQYMSAALSREQCGRGWRLGPESQTE